jgi:SARP family transcriptional regulator, regulator of embCAB operon
VAESRTAVQLCGHLAVELQGRRVEETLPPGQGVLLFAYLVLNRHRAMSRDELVDAIWPDGAPSAPDVALRALLSKLRRALGADAIVGRTALQIALPADARIDLDVALNAVHLAESAVANQRWEAAYAKAHIALYIAERDVLSGYEAPWLDSLRRTLADVRARAHECCAEASLALGGTELRLAELHGRKLVALEPYRESGYVLLMRALEAQRNIAEAMRVYDELRRLLRDELGMAPGSGVQELHERLLRPDGVTPTA